MKMMIKMENVFWCFMFTLGVELPRNFVSRIYNYLKYISIKE